MRLRALTIIAAMLPASLLVAADDAATCEVRTVERSDETIEYDACESQVWFTDSRPGIGNLGHTGLVDRPTWSTEPPSGSYQSGEGYISFGKPTAIPLPEEDEAGWAIFEGGFTGAIDTMSVTIHGSHTGYASQGDPTTRKNPSLLINLRIDGTDILYAGPIEIPAEEAPNAQGLHVYTFTFTNLDYAMLRAKMDLAADTEHSLELALTSNYVNTGLHQFFVYGTTEVDGNIVFNDLDLAEDAFTIKA